MSGGRSCKQVQKLLSGGRSCKQVRTDLTVELRKTLGRFFAPFFQTCQVVFFHADYFYAKAGRPLLHTERLTNRGHPLAGVYTKSRFCNEERFRYPEAVERRPLLPAGKRRSHSRASKKRQVGFCPLFPDLSSRHATEYRLLLRQGLFYGRFYTPSRSPGAEARRLSRFYSLGSKLSLVFRAKFAMSFYRYGFSSSF